MIEKSLNKDNHESKETDQGQTNSLFDEPEKNMNDNNKDNLLQSKNIFDSINFNEMKEKKVENENANKNTNKNMNTNTNRNENSGTNNSKNEAKLALKNKLKNKKYLKEIENLKSKINYLISSNKRLTKKVVNYESKKIHKLDDNVISFIDKYDEKVDSLKNKLKVDKKNIENFLTEKEDLLDEKYSEASQKFTELKSNIKNLNNQVTEITKNQNEIDQKIKDGLEIDKLKVDNNIDIKGVLYSKKLSAKELNLNSIKIDSSKLKINSNTKLQIGNQIYNLDNFINNLNYISKLSDYCGEEFSKCKIISKENLIEQKQKQENILENLKKLRTDANLIIYKKHKKSR